jgi:hypothetical protein
VAVHHRYPSVLYVKLHGTVTNVVNVWDGSITKSGVRKMLQSHHSSIVCSKAIVLFNDLLVGTTLLYSNANIWNCRPLVLGNRGKLEHLVVRSDFRVRKSTTSSKYCGLSVGVGIEAPPRT